MNGAASKFPDMHDLSNYREHLRFYCENFDLKSKLVGP